jgi:hypothetical protein
MTRHADTLGDVCVLCLAQVLGNEESAVSDICTPAGLRPAPDAADLRHFVDVISSMDGLRVAELLRAKMVGTSLVKCGLEGGRGAGRGTPAGTYSPGVARGCHYWEV